MSIIIEVEVDAFGVHAEIEVYDKAKKAGFKVLSSRELNRLDNGARPCGVNKGDTIEDAIKRADSLSGVGSHSGTMCNNKDLRRIVLLSHEVRRLERLLAIRATPSKCLELPEVDFGERIR